MLRQKNTQPHKRTVTVLGVLICTVAALFYCYEYLLRIIPGVMEPQLRVAFGDLSASTFGTLAAYYYFAYTPMQLPVGILMDRFGPRRLLIFACLLCAVGSWLFVATSQYAIAAFGRFLIGFGSAFAFVGVLALALVWLPQRYFSMIAGLVTGLGMVGAIAGQVGMTYMVDAYGWSFVLSGAFIVGVVLCVLMLMTLRDSPSFMSCDRQSVNWLQFLRNSFSVLISPQIWIIGTVGALHYLSLSVFAEVWGKSYLMVAYGFSNMKASSAIAMVFLGWAIGAPLSGYLADVLDRRATFIVSGAVLGAITISLLLYVPNLSFFNVYLLLFLYGLCCSVEIIVFALAKNNVSPSLAATAIAVVNMIVMLGGVIFQPLVGHLLDYFWNGNVYHHVRVYTHGDFQLVLSFLPLSLLLVAVLGFFLKDEKEHD